MTPEQLDKARADDAFHYAEESDPAANQSEKLRKAFERYRAHILSNWTPPDPISPRVRAMREYLKTATTLPGPDIDAGKVDYRFDAKAFLAGFAAAVKLAEPVVEAAQKHVDLSINPPLQKATIGLALQTYRQSIGEGE